MHFTHSKWKELYTTDTFEGIVIAYLTDFFYNITYYDEYIIKVLFSMLWNPVSEVTGTNSHHTVTTNSK